MSDSDLGNFTHLLDATPHYSSYEALKALAERMTYGASASRRSRNLKAAHVYFGQFMSHDISFLSGRNSSHSNPQQNAAEAGSPRLDLDSVYGGGWDDPRCDVDKRTGEMNLGLTGAVDNRDFEAVFTPGFDDLPRDLDSLEARIPDARNDENLILAQLHVVCLKLHNLAVRNSPDHIRFNPVLAFEYARKELTRGYHRLIVQEFLKKICHPYIYQKVVLDGQLRIYRRRLRDPLPVEFSAAAFRFGHSSIRLSYKLNDAPSLKLKDLFQWTGKGKLNGHRSLPADLVVNWDFMLGVKNRARLLDPVITPFDVPNPAGKATVLALRNLLRGNQVGLPSGQKLLAALKVMYGTDRELSDAIDSMSLTSNYIAERLQQMDIVSGDAAEDDFAQDRAASEWKQHIGELKEQTPLWFYLLVEAENPQQGKGDHLGFLGSLIVSSVLMEVLETTPNSGYRPGVLPELVTENSMSEGPASLEAVMKLVS